MPIVVTCPNCGGALRAPESAAGRKIRCARCQEVVTVPASEDVATTPLPPVPPSDRDAEPRQPNRGGFILSMGIVGLVLSILSVPFLICGACCPPVGFGGSAISLPFSYIGLLAGIRDVRLMRFNAPGRGPTVAGLACGAVGAAIGTVTTLINAILLLLFVINLMNTTRNIPTTASTNVGVEKTDVIRPEPVDRELESVFWIMTEREVGGQKVALGNDAMMIENGEAVWSDRDGAPQPGRVHDKVTFDTSKNPRTIDWEHPHLQSGKVGIYKIEGDKLVIAFGELGSKTRPTKFTSKLTARIGRAGEVQTFKAKR